MADAKFDCDLFSFQAPSTDSSLPTKLCWRCNQTKPTDEFGKDASRGDGLNPRCKACCADVYQARAEANPRSEKQCSFCKLVKPISEFDVGSGEKRSLPRKRCRACIALYGTGTPAHLRKPVPRSPNAAENNKRYREKLKEREIVQVPLEKRCCSCLETKPAEEFHKNKSAPDGLAGQCKVCKMAEYAATYEKRAANYAPVGSKICQGCLQEKAASEFYKQTAARDGLSTYCVKCLPAITSANYQKNREDRIRAAWIWQKMNPERERAARIAGRCNKRAKAAGAEGTFAAQEWIELLEACECKCFYCGETEIPRARLTADHKIPFDRGGTGWITNVAPSCLPCNTSKKNKTPEEFAAWREANADILALKRR